MSASSEARRSELYGLLGELPERDRPISVTTIGQEQHELYVLEKLMLDLNDTEPVPAYFVRPNGKHERRPVVLYNHAHGGDYVLGKDELLNARHAIQQPPYAVELTRYGWSALCIDHFSFGERRGRSETALFKQMLWSGRVLWGMMVYDSLRAVDYLVSRPDVDAGRIGTLGLSMGSTMAWWLAALDERIRVCVDICCLTDFDALIETNGLDEHGVYYFVPNLLKHFNTTQINELIVPRAHLSLAGNFDPLTPPAGLDRIDAALQEAYRQAGAREAWKLLRYDIAHFETAAMRAEVVAFLQQWL